MLSDSLLQELTFDRILYCLHPLVINKEETLIGTQILTIMHITAFSMQMDVLSSYL